MKTFSFSKISQLFNLFINDKVKFWFFIFIIHIVGIFIWDLIFLNNSALSKLSFAVFNTFFISIISVFFSFIIALAISILYSKSKTKNRKYSFLIIFILDFVDSIPQIILLLMGYLTIIFVIPNSAFLQTLWLIIVLSAIFINNFFHEIIGRIEHFKKIEFYNASLVLGINETEIIVRDILFANSLNHLLNRAIIVFSSMIFLFCSVDFIVSVGLSANLTLAELPKTLGNILASLDSKQDILSIRILLTNPFYIWELLTVHLQGISTMLILIVTLVSTYKISNALIEKKKLF